MEITGLRVHPNGKPHEMDLCAKCNCTRFQHKGKLGHETKCLVVTCNCDQFE
jgi:hypothetical protein